MSNKKIKRLLTLEDLELFYSNKKKSFHFSADNDTDAIVVQIPGVITFSEDDYDPTLGLLPVHLASCHLGINRNKSSISEDTMNQAISSIYNRPILGYIHKLLDGSYDFAGHEMFINDDGEIEYEEIAVGTIPESCNAKLVYDEEKDKTYLEVDGYVYEEYTRAADILRDKKQSKVSVELSLLDFSYDAKSKNLSIDKFYFSGVTILGVTRDGNETPIEEGMYGSNIKLKDFSTKNNSIFSNETEEMKEKLIEMQESINALLSRFNINQDSKESIENYGKEEKIQVEDQVLVNEEVVEVETTVEMEEVVEDVVVATETESTEEATDTVTENESEEPVEGTPVVVVEESVEESAEITEEFIESEVETEIEIEVEESFSEDEVETVTVVEEVSVKPEKYSITMSDGTTKEFELTLDDITYAIFNLVNDMYGEIDNTYYYVSVYETGYVIMHDYWNGRAYKQSYSREEDAFSLVGNRVEVFANWLTADEEAALAEMRTTYSSISAELNAYKEAEAIADKMTVFEDEAYSSYLETDEFKSLMERETVKKFSKEELAEKADAALGKIVKATKTFSVNEEKKEEKKPSFFAFARQEKETSFLDKLLNEGSK